MLENVFSEKRLLAGLDRCRSFEGINAREVAEKLAALAGIGRTAEGGVSRFPYTKEERDAKRLFAGWMEEAGMAVREDAIGNLIGRLEGSEGDLPVVLTGSHLDSVPNGGAFDGPLGCMSSLLAVKAIANSGLTLRRSLEVVVFVDEEGARFNNSLFGSRAVMGEITEEQLHSLKDKEGVTMADAMREYGFSPQEIGACQRDPKEIYAFLELHIEQGKRLESGENDIGIVSGIAGPSWTAVTFLGETDHAGNTPMGFRKDTVAAAAELISFVEKLPGQYNDTAVATVGKVNVFPNGTNVVAGKTEVVADIRDIDLSVRDQMLESLRKSAEDIAVRRGLEVEVREEVKIPPVLVPQAIQEVIESAAAESGLSSAFLPSGAGHDAMIMGKYVPAGMVFVPSHRGKSHSPEEWTPLAACVNGIQVMRLSLEKLAGE